MKGDLMHIVAPHQHHPCHPQRDDVTTRDQYTRRIEVFEIGSLVWPTERRMRPKCRTEPRVKHILFTYEPSTFEDLRQRVILSSNANMTGGISEAECLTFLFIALRAGFPLNRGG